MEDICIHRVKTGKPLGTIKWELFRSKKEMFCNICGKDCSDTHIFLYGDTISHSHMDHIVPIFVGGDMRNKDNLQILCHKCHGKKSGIDRKIIKILIERGLLIKKVGYNQCESIPKLIEEYKKLFNKLKSTLY